MNKAFVAAALVASTMFAQPALAATLVVSAGGSGTVQFTGDNATVELGNIFSAPLNSFSNSFHFILNQSATLMTGGLNTQQVKLRSAVVSDLDISSVELGGFALSGPNGNDNSENFSLTSNLLNRVFEAGTYTVSVNGKVDTASAAFPASYAGPFSFQSVPTQTAAVPEPATWAMMLLGFGAIGFGMRRRGSATARVRFSFA